MCFTDENVKEVYGTYGNKSKTKIVPGTDSIIHGKMTFVIGKIVYGGNGPLEYSLYSVFAYS